MNKNPRHIVSTRIIPTGPALFNTCSGLIKAYDGLLSNECVSLLAKEWPHVERGLPRIISVFDGFDDAFNVHKFVMGFTSTDKPRFRQTTIFDLLLLGIEERKMGLIDFVYALGSAAINPREKIACGMVSPMVYNPGLESMDGIRQMMARAIRNPWSTDTKVALVEL